MFTLAEGNDHRPTLRLCLRTDVGGFTIFPARFAFYFFDELQTQQTALGGKMMGSCVRGNTLHECDLSRFLIRSRIGQMLLHE